MNFYRSILAKYLRYGGINLKITTDITVKIKIVEEVTKEEYLNFMGEKSFDERKKEFEQDVIDELKGTFDTEGIKIHEFNVKVEED